MDEDSRGRQTMLGLNIQAITLSWQTACCWYWNCISLSITSMMLCFLFFSAISVCKLKVFIFHSWCLHSHQGPFFPRYRKKRSMEVRLNCQKEVEVQKYEALFFFPQSCEDMRKHLFSLISLLLEYYFLLLISICIPFSISHRAQQQWDVLVLPEHHITH